MRSLLGQRAFQEGDMWAEQISGNMEEHVKELSAERYQWTQDESTDIVLLE